MPEQEPNLFGSPPAYWLYIFEEEAIVGSSNLTQGGLTINREANVILDSEEDLDQLRELFSEFWEDAQVLTPDKLAAFTKAWSGKRGAQDPDPWIESAVGAAEPQNSSVPSRKKSNQSIFQESLRRQIAEYGAAFREINDVLRQHQLGRDELKEVGPSHRTNRFLNWVRLTKAPGEDAWKEADRRPADQRATLIAALGRAGLDSDHTQIPEEYLGWLHTVTTTFGTKDAIADATQEDLTAGLLSLHAFHERLRFVDGGLKNLPRFFWAANQNDVAKVRRSLSYLVHGSGEFLMECPIFCAVGRVSVAQPFLSSSSRRRGCGEVGSA